MRAYRLRFNPLRNVLIRHYLKNTDTIFAVSSALAEALRQNGIGGVEVLYNGIDVERFVATAEDIDAFKKKQHLCGKRVMLFAGRLSRAKGGDVAFALFKKVHEALPEICLLVVGKEDAYARRLVRQAQDAELEDHVILTGWLSQEEMVLAYAASDLVLFLSLYLDAFGMVNLEAMAAHKPVIGTCFGGTPEVIVDGETGYIVDPHNLARVAERTLAILTNSARAQRFGRAGYERARSAFSLTRQVDALERYYRAMA